MALGLGLSAKTAIRGRDVGLLVADFQRTDLGILSDRF